MNIFDSPEFKEFSKSLEAAMADSARAPNVVCPSCNQIMTHCLGLNKLAGYQCGNRFDCSFAGRQITVEELADAEKWAAVKEEARIRKEIHDDMLRRNSAHFRGDPQLDEYWCGDCHGYHKPTSEHPLCPLHSCFSLHAPMPSDLYFDFNGWRFRAPFHCMCCGKKICFRQWAFGRNCGACDTGACQKKHLHTRKRHGVYYGNAELIDPNEAKEYRFTPERMFQVSKVEPEEWI